MLMLSGTLLTMSNSYQSNDLEKNEAARIVMGATKTVSFNALLTVRANENPQFGHGGPSQ